MSRALDLAVKLPGTMALFRAGPAAAVRVKIIVYVTSPLDRARRGRRRNWCWAGRGG